MSAQGAAATEAEGVETQREEITTAKGEEHIITLYTSFHSDYCNYTWESARVLAWHLAVCELNGLKGKRVLEMGCGTALPGLLAARCGASVTLTDAHTAQGALDRARLAAAANNLEDRVTTLPWTWGEWTAEVLSLPTPDLIIASDCLYARSDYEAFFCGASWFLHKSQKPRLLMAYRDRVAGRSMQPFLWRWRLTCRELDLGALPSRIEEDARGMVRLFEFRAIVA